MKFVDRIFVCLLCLVILSPILLWVASMFGADVVNPLSEEGIRNAMMHGGSIVLPSAMGLFLVGFTAVGMLLGSGLLKSFCGPTTLLQRRGHISSLIVLILSLLVFFALYIWPNSPVMSLSGHFKHSPLIFGMPFLICFTLMGMSIAYGLSSRTIRRWSQLVDLICYGIRHYSALFYVLYFLLLIYDHIKSVL